MRKVVTKADGVGDTLPAANFNAERDELENAVESTDQVLDPDAGPDSDLNMLGKAIAAYANAGAIYQDSGAVNTHVLSITSNLKAVNKYYDNMMIVFKSGSTNTGAATVNVNTIGVKNITRPDGTTLSAGDIILNAYVIAIYNLGNDRFELATIQTIVLHDHSDATSGGTDVVAADAPATPVADKLYTEGLAKAWGNFDGTGTPAYAKKYNMDAAITDNGTGDYSVTFVTDMADANYIVTGSCSLNVGNSPCFITFDTLATTGFNIKCYTHAGASSDTELITFVVYGDQ